MRSPALLLLLLAPGCVIPSSAGLGVVSLTDMMWTGVGAASEEGQHDVDLKWGQPNALRQVYLTDGGRLVVTSAWNDGRSHVHEGLLPRRAGELVELEEDTEADPDPHGSLPGPELRVVVEGSGGSELLVPGHTVSIAGFELRVEPEGEGAPRPLARLGPIHRRETRTSAPRVALLGTGAVLLTPATVVLDAAWFVVSLPVVGVLLLMD